MKMIVLLKAASPALSRQFYEAELGLFKLKGEMWESACTMQAVESADVEVELTRYHRAPSEVPAFTLVVPDCAREFARLRTTHFASGGRLVPDDKGELAMFDYPGGANFMMEDPDGNRFLIHEDFTARINE